MDVIGLAVTGFLTIVLIFLYWLVGYIIFLICKGNATSYLDATVKGFMTSTVIVIICILVGYFINKVF